MRTRLTPYALFPQWLKGKNLSRRLTDMTPRRSSMCRMRILPLLQAQEKTLSLPLARTSLPTPLWTNALNLLPALSSVLPSRLCRT